LVVTGDNGHGKSSLCEAVCWATWGRLLRGTRRPWSEDLCEVEITVGDGLVVKRRKKGSGSPRLRWSLSGSADGFDRHDTTKHAQDDLDHLVGSFEEWRRTHVFSSTDSMTFAASPDGDRKRLLEALLGLGVLDAAEKSVGAEQRRLDDVVRHMAISCSRLAGKLETLKEEMARTKRALSPTEVPELPIWATRENLEEARREYRSMRATEAELREEVARRGERVAVIEQKLLLLSGGTCPTCEREVPQSMVDGVRALVEESRVDAEGQRDSARGQVVRLRSLAAEAEEEAHAIDAVISEHEAKRVTRSAAQDSYKESMERVRRASMSLSSEAAKVKVVERDLLVARTARDVLGTRGVRSQLLGEALASLESAANVWLERLGGGIEVRARTWTETRTAGVKDTIDLIVVGAGGDEGYAACSTGQRRRVDVAVLMGLADVAAASSGRELGTMWADECFDALDAGARAALADALSDVSGTRPVVIITHNDDLVDQVRSAIPRSSSAHVTSGRIS
jgi:DNA repair exonuclease SbcCD ATPase subunit